MYFVVNRRGFFMAEKTRVLYITDAHPNQLHWIQVAQTDKLITFAEDTREVFLSGAGEFTEYWIDEKHPERDTFTSSHPLEYHRFKERATNK
jgi:hypothetical protein